MPKVKRGAPKLGRRVNGRHGEHGRQKRGSGVGSKAAASRRTSARAAASPIDEEAAPTDEELPAPPPARKPSQAAVGKRKERDEQPESQSAASMPRTHRKCQRISALQRRADMKRLHVMAGALHQPSAWRGITHSRLQST